MKRKFLAVIMILNILFMGAFISIPTLILLSDYLHASRIDESKTYYYSSAPPFEKELNLNVDIGEIEINYIAQPVEYLIKLEMVIEMGGDNLAEKSYLDFFNVFWENTSDSVNFTLEIKPGLTLVEILALIRNITIIITLRMDLICNFNINIKIDGDVKLTVPYMVSVGNILTNLSNGNIKYDFRFCLIEGNITGIIRDTGNIELIANEVQYTQNSTWSLYNYNGDILLQIYQNNSMNANVLGNISPNYGIIEFTYIDDNINNGASFTLHYNPFDGAFYRELDKVIGFNQTHDSAQDIIYLESYDYPAKSNYKLFFHNSNGLYALLNLKSI